MRGAMSARVRWGLFYGVMASAALGASYGDASDNLVFFGTHAIGTGRGLSVAHFDSDTGVLSKPELVLEAAAPAFFVIHTDGRHLYACNSNDFAKGYTGQTVSAYAIEPASGRLSLVNQQPSGGAIRPTSRSTPRAGTCSSPTTRAVASPSWPSGPTAAWASEPPSSSTPAAASIPSARPSPTRTASASTRPTGSRWSPTSA